MPPIQKELVPPQYPGVLRRLEHPKHIVVIGGGLAGMAAATILAERGAKITVIEHENQLGGRARGWASTLPDGTPVQLERGFHAFFRQYYNLRKLFERIDPRLRMLVPMADYPVLAPDGKFELFVDIPRFPPANIMAMVRQSPVLHWYDLLKIGFRHAFEMLAYDQDKTFARWDGVSAAQFLDEVNVPKQARAMIFDVFAHSFFNPEAELSAAEMLQYYHFYFTHNPEGLTFDALDQPLHTAIWEPLTRYLQPLGCALRLGTDAVRIDKTGDKWVVHTRPADLPPDAATEPIGCDGVVLAATAVAVRDIVAASVGLGTPEWRGNVGALRATNHFAVQRFWFDRPVRADRPVFAAIAGGGILDSIAVYNYVADTSAQWAARTGGSEVEIHAYAAPAHYTSDQVRDEMIAKLHHFYPETKDAKVLHHSHGVFHDSPAFPVGSGARRPRVHTPEPTVTLAGDYTWIPLPSGLMERAVASGFLAANCLLSNWNVRGEPLWSVPRRGYLADWIK